MKELKSYLDDKCKAERTTKKLYLGHGEETQVP